MQKGAGSVSGRETAVAFAILIATAIALGLVFVRTPHPHSDALRYITYALNLLDHGVFSLSDIASTEPPKPGSGHTPLYPAWVAAFAALDDGFRNTLVCVLEHNVSRAPCQLDLRFIQTAQLALAGVFLGCVWLLARRLSGSSAIAWLAALCALLARNPLQYANQLLTEALLLPLLGLFTVFLAIAYQDRRPRWMLAAGAALGLAALTRPAYAYLFLALGGVLAIVALVGWQRRLMLACVLFALAYAAVVTPWMVRNERVADRFALTTAYAGDILAQRVAYNRMSWGEIGAAFIFWFPDFGDELASAIFPDRYYRKLGWNPGSYYASVAPELYEAAERQAGGPENVVGFLLRTEILADPIKHAFVSLPLAFRAVFVSKYWSVLGLACFIVLVIRQVRRGEYDFLLLSLPVWFMVAFHSLVSVSIPRYNLALILFYAYAMAWAIHSVGCKLRAVLRRRTPAY